MAQGYFDLKTGKWVEGAPSGQAAQPAQQSSAQPMKPVATHKQSITARNRQLPSGEGVVKNPNTENLKELAKITGKAGLGAGGAALSLYGGTIPNWLMRMLTVGAGGGIQAAGRGEDISSGAGAEMLMEGIMTGPLPKGLPGAVRRIAPRLFNDPTAGPGLTGHFMKGGVSEALPYMGHRGALFVSGAHGANRGGNREVANAAIDLRNPLNIGGVELGNIKQNKINLANPNTARRRAEDLGKKLETAETSSTQTVPVRDAFEGVVNKASQQATSGGDPFGRISALKGTEQDFIIDQAALAEMRQAGLDPSTVSADTAKRLEGYFQNPTRRRNIWTGQAKKSNLDMQGLGNIRRRARAEADDLIASRAAGGGDLAENKVSSEFYDAIYRESKALQEGLVPELKGINKQFSDLFRVEEAMDPVRGVGRSQLGAAGVRGGLGHGLASNAQSVFPATQGLAKFLAPAAVFLGAPPAITKGGGLAGTAANMIPSASRLTDLTTLDDEDTPSTAVRGPLGATFEDPEMRKAREARDKEQARKDRARRRPLK